MPLLVGAFLALAVGALLGTGVGLDRDRAFYPTIAAVVASYYVLFAAMADSTYALLVETAVAGVFLAVAMAGFRGSLWLAVAALAGHGVFDAIHDRLIVNPGVPVWWPAFCGAYDVVAAAYLAFLLLRPRQEQGA